MTPEQIIKEQAPDDLALLNYIEQEGLTRTDANAIAKAWKAACRYKAAQLSKDVEQSDEVSLEQAAIKYGDGWRTISSMQMDSPISLGKILTSIEIGYMTDGFIDGWKTHDLLTRHKATQLFKQQGKDERLD